MDRERVNEIIDQLIAMMAILGLMLVAMNAALAALFAVLSDPLSWLGMGMFAAAFFLARKRGW